MTARESRYIHMLLGYRDRPPTIGRIFRASLPAYLVLAAVFGAAAIAVSGMAGGTGPLLLLVSFVTMILRDLGNSRRSIAFWPLTREAIDWTKVEAMAAASPTPASSAR